MNPSANDLIAPSIAIDKHLLSIDGEEEENETTSVRLSSSIQNSVCYSIPVNILLTNTNLCPLFESTLDESRTSDSRNRSTKWRRRETASIV